MWENGIYLGKGNSGRIETVGTHGLRPQILQSYKSSFKQLLIALLFKKTNGYYCIVVLKNGNSSS